MIDNIIEKTKIESVIKKIESNTILPKDLVDKLIDTIKSQNSFLESLLNVIKKYEGEDANIKTLENALRNIKKQGEMAKAIQDSIFPSSLPNNDIISITAKLFPMNETSGDFYDAIEIIPNRVYGLLIADISGHGVSAALITNLAKILFTNAVEKFASPKDVMSYINTEFCNILHQRTYFTSFYSILDFPNKQIVYSSAGHPYNIKYNAQSKQIERLFALDTVIGIFSNIYFKEKKFDIHIGDRLILYTDGIPEARNQKGEMFGEKRLLNLLYENIEAPPKQLIELIEYKVKKFMQKDYFEDDVTIIIVDIKSYDDKNEDSKSDKGYLSKDELSRLIEYYKKSIKIKEEYNDKVGLIKDLKNLSSNILSKGKIQEALEYIERAKSLSEELNDKKLIGEIAITYGNVYLNIGEFEAAIKYYNEALENFSNNDKENISTTYNNLSIIYAQQNNFEKAKEYIFKGIKIQEDMTKNVPVMKNFALFYNNLGIISSEENDNNKALEYFLKSAEIAEKYNMLTLQSVLLNNIGNAYIINNDLEKALKYIYKGLQILEEIDHKDILPTMFLNISLINFIKGEKELAFYNLNKGINIAKKCNILIKEASLKVERAYQYLKINQLKECLDDLLDSFTINQKLKTDTSNGQIKIVIGILLYKIDKYTNSQIIKEKYEKLLPFLEGETQPEHFFEKAMEESKSQTSISSLFILASCEYAIYLYNKKDNETYYKKSIELLKEAIKMADDSKYLIEKSKVKKVIVELKLEDNFKELF